MNLPLKVYLDTNIIRDLSENRGKNCSDYKGLICSLVSDDMLVVAPSFEVLYELLSSPDISDDKQKENAFFYESIVNWKYALKDVVPIVVGGFNGYSCSHTLRYL
jgi:hypothetical protein